MKRLWVYLLLGVLWTTTAVACRPLTKEDPIESDPDPPPGETAVSPLPTDIAVVFPTSTSRPVFPPSARPTANFLADWQTIGNSSSSLQLALPANWDNLAGEMDAAALTTPLGLITLLATDSPNTGMALLAQKPLNTGALVVGLTRPSDLAATSPLIKLGVLLPQLATAVTPLTAVQRQPIGSPDLSLRAASVELLGHPLPHFAHTATTWHTQMILISPTNPHPTNSPTDYLLLFSAPVNAWDEYAQTFARILSTISGQFAGNPIFSTETAVLLGQLPAAEVSSALQKSRRDIWSFPLESPRYLSLAARPGDDALDLSVRLIAPDGQTVFYLDNGYGPLAERAIDIPLTLPGLYLIEIEDFAGTSGRYTLTWTLTTDLTYTGHDHLELDESLQTTLAPNGPHAWTFNGMAGQSVSVVLTPLDEFDAILNLYGPDGTRLAALDEGFSGDPEVVSGLRLPITGEYTIFVSSFADVAGLYTLTLSRGGEPTANFYDAGDLIIGQTHPESLRPHEAHAWFFSGQAGTNIMLRVTPLAENLDLDIWLLDPDINRLAAVDEFLVGEAEVIQQQLPVDGQYLVLIREFTGQPGDYEISLVTVTDAPPVYAGAISVGSVMSNSLPTGQNVFWLLEGVANERVTITVRPLGTADSPPGDLILQLQSPDGIIMLTLDETTVGGAESIISYQLPVAGQWHILVQEFFGAAVNYELRVSPGEN